MPDGGAGNRLHPGPGPIGPGPGPWSQLKVPELDGFVGKETPEVAVTEEFEPVPEEGAGTNPRAFEGVEAGGRNTPPAKIGAAGEGLETAYLEAIKEQVPGFEGKFRITQDVTVSASKAGDGMRALLSASKTVSITGELQYQACDKTICYPPTSVPVKWELQVRPLDLKRSPKAIQHR